MPTATGGETIGERLTRLRTDLARVRETIARAEANGQSFSIRGSSVTQIGYEHALERARKLKADIAALEARLTGKGGRPGIANLESRSW